MPFAGYFEEVHLSRIVVRGPIYAHNNQRMV